MDNSLENYILLTCDQVIELTSLGRSTLYDNIKKGTFPAPYKVGVRKARWKRIEILEWIDNLKKERDEMV